MSKLKPACVFASRLKPTISRTRCSSHQHGINTQETINLIHCETDACTHTHMPARVHTHTHTHVGNDTHHLWVGRAFWIFPNAKWALGEKINNIHQIPSVVLWCRVLPSDPECTALLTHHRWTKSIRITQQARRNNAATSSFKLLHLSPNKQANGTEYLVMNALMTQQGARDKPQSTCC